jgi:hypothetical protein
MKMTTGDIKELRMKATPPSGAWRTWVFLALVFMAACAETPKSVSKGPGGVVVESVFLEGDHGAERCLGQLAKSLRDLPDGVLFFDRDSRIRTTPPRGPGIESYHVHLFHRVGADVLDHVARQNDAGIIELDLSRFDQPEELVVVSSSYRFSKELEGPEKGQAAREEEARIPPYAMAFRLVSADQSDLVMSLQPFRYVMETTLGNLSLFVQPFNRRDMLLTWMDPAKKLGALIQDAPYVHLKKEDAYIPPRLVVDVLRAKEAKSDLPWQRSGTWHLPASGVRSENPDEKPFSFRVPGKELISFGPPARVDFRLPERAPATTARIEARYAGVRPKDALQTVFAVGYPGGGRAKETAFRIETQEVSVTTQSGSFLANLADQDPSRFPIHAALVHRLVQPWRVQGGAYAPEPPLGTNAVSLEPKGGPGGIHARVVTPRYASHYDFLSFLGGIQGKSALDGLLRGAGSPNLAPPSGDPLGGPIAGPGVGVGDDVPAPRQPSPPPAGGGGGGKDTNCGCGPGPAPGMPSPGCPSKHKCKGQCGQACPGNGHCKDDNGGKVTLEFPCPPSPKGCEQDRKSGECKCGPHPWDMNTAMSAVMQLFPGAADYSWFGMHNGRAPCDGTTEIGRVRVSFWAAAGFGMTHVWCGVSASFGPCVKLKVGGGNPGGGLGGGPPIPGGFGPGSGGGSGGGSIVALASTVPNGPVTATVTGINDTSLTSLVRHPVGPNDPNTMVHVDTISDALGIQGPLHSGFLLYDPPTLAMVLSGPATSIAEVYHAANQSTVRTTMANTDTGLDLPFFLEGLLEVVAGGGGGGGVPPPIPPIPPGCGALGIEFILGISLLASLFRRIVR